MTKQEIVKIITVMQTNYPDDFRGMSDEVLKAKINLWHSQFQDDDYQTVMSAVMAHIATDTNRFMPPVGVIKAKLVQITTPRELSELEAWALVERAISGASMSPQSMMYRNGVTDGKTSAERNFDKLPPLLKRIVGNPGQLAAWGAMNEETVGTVIASNFQRSYRAIAAKEREHMALPSDVRRVMEQIGGAMSMPALEGETL